MLLLVLAGPVVAVQSQPSPTSTPVGQEQQNDAAGQSDDGNADGDQAMPAPKPVLPDPQAPEPDAIDVGSNIEAPEDWRIVLFTGVLAGVAVLQLIAMWFQSIYMREGLTETRKATEAAKASAEAARDAVHVGTLQQRAWLTVEVVRLPTPKRLADHAPGLSTFGIVVTNSGLTPASNIVILTPNFKSGRAGSYLPSQASAGGPWMSEDSPDIAPRAIIPRIDLHIANQNALPFVCGMIKYRHTGDTLDGETLFCVEFADDRPIFTHAENTVR